MTQKNKDTQSDKEKSSRDKRREDAEEHKLALNSDGQTEGFYERGGSDAGALDD